MHGTRKREWVWLIIAKNSIDSIVNEGDWPWVGKFNMALHTNYESVYASWDLEKKAHDCCLKRFTYSSDLKHSLKVPK